MIVQRNNLFYVVAYNGHDPITGRERRRWHPAGSDMGDAEEVRRRIDRQRPNPSCAMSLGRFMSTTWLATKGTLTHATANRYRWMIDHNIAPRVGAIRLDALRPDDLDAGYGDLIANGGRRRQGLAPKSVLEIHRGICNALDLAVDHQPIDTKPARRARPPKPTSRSTVPAIWNAQQLGRFLSAANRLRFYPALHLVAHTGMRRDEVAGLNWGDLDVAASSLSIVRTRQATMGRDVEGLVKTGTSRRRIDLDANTVALLDEWRVEETDQPKGRNRASARLNHTHATILLEAGVPAKVVSERLGHANAAFTMSVYQHILPGMQADAAHIFANEVFGEATRAQGSTAAMEPRDHGPFRGGDQK